MPISIKKTNILSLVLLQFFRGRRFGILTNIIKKIQPLLLKSKGKEKKKMFVDLSSDHKNCHNFDNRHVYQEALKNNTLKNVEQIGN